MRTSRFGPRNEWLTIFYGRRSGHLSRPGVVLPDDLVRVRVKQLETAPGTNLRNTYNRLHVCDGRTRIRLLRPIHVRLLYDTVNGILTPLKAAMGTLVCA